MFKATKINLVISSLFSVTALAADLTTDKIEVISQTPLPSIGISINQLPSNIQTVKAKDIEKSQALDITDYMNQNLAGVNINENQTNPLQPDVNYHGYTASPLLGTPQGLSVYIDGVRMNQPFGDVVSWDLIPKNAIYGMQMYSGSNPLFGLNTLGGSLSIQTKDGRNSPGGAMQLTAGSWGRRIGEFEYGGVSKDNSVDYFVAGTWFDEDGWRDASPSENKQLFGKLGWQGEKTSAKLTYALSDGDLTGNGLAPRSLLANNSEAVYSSPDNTNNRSHFLNLQVEHDINNNMILSGNAYYRNIKTKTYNGDVNGEGIPAIDWNQISRDLPTFVALESATSGASGRSWHAANATGGNPFGSQTQMTSTGTGPGDINNLDARCKDQNDQGEEGGEKCSAFINRTQTNQQNIGIFGQLSARNTLFGRPNNYVLGGGFDLSRSHFTQSAEFGSLRSDRSVLGTGEFATTAQGNVSNLSILDNSVNLKGKTDTGSIFASDTFSVRDNLNVTAAGRYNYTIVNNKDKQTHFNTYYGNIVDNKDVGGDNAFGFYGTSGTITTTQGGTIDLANAISYIKNNYKLPSGDSTTDAALKQVDYANPVSEASLSGRHVFHRFNPSLGLTYDFNDSVNFYGNYNEGSRAPTPIELGCANPEQPCNLPNAMAGDPALKQVVSKTWEGGVRVRESKDFTWSAGAYTSRNVNDIMFVGQSTSGAGYFKNIGQTERKGFDFSFKKQIDRLGISANYSFIDATFESDQQMISNANSAGDYYCVQNNGGNCQSLTYDATPANYKLTNSSSIPANTLATNPAVRNQTAQSLSDLTFYKVIDVKKGDRIPLIPKNILKLYASYQVNDKFVVAANTLTVTSSFMRGNENNADPNGRLAAYTTLNLTAAYKPFPEWMIFAKVNNVFDREYATSGQLGMNALTPSGALNLVQKTGSSWYSDSTADAFVAPGAPRAMWVGARWEFGGRKSSGGLDKD